MKVIFYLLFSLQTLQILGRLKPDSSTFAYLDLLLSIFCILMIQSIHLLFGLPRGLSWRPLFRLSFLCRSFPMDCSEQHDSPHPCLHIMRYAVLYWSPSFIRQHFPIIQQRVFLLNILLLVSRALGSVQILELTIEMAL